jgi:hypothetical protein
MGFAAEIEHIKRKGKILAQVCTVIFRFTSRLFGLSFLRLAKQGVVIEAFGRINAKGGEGV